MTPKTPIAIDAMGGDRGPAAVVEGILRARARFGGKYLVFGRPHVLEQEFQKLSGSIPEEIVIRPADEIITMDDAPVEAIREKKNSSLVLAARAVREKNAAAIVSPGNTGAVLAAGTLILGRCRGVERAGIAAVIPTPEHYSVLIDVGANVDCRPIHLLHFAIMGMVYARVTLGIQRPRIGLLSIGEERSKGNELTLAAAPLCEQFFRSIDSDRGVFLGNIEGRDIVNGRADVVVCDGFTGNAVLKFGEALAFTITDLLKERITAGPVRKIGALLLRGAFRELKNKIDYSEYGGAPLLGVRSPCIICHGSSNPRAIMNALRVAREQIEQDICGRIERMVSEFTNGGNGDNLKRKGIVSAEERKRKEDV